MYEELNGDMDKQSRTEKVLFAELYNLGLQPESQYQISQMHVDFAFPDERVVIEVDGPHHNTIEGKERDKKRYAELKKRGWKVLSYNAEEVHTQTKMIAEKIKGELEKISKDLRIASFEQKHKTKLKELRYPLPKNIIEQLDKKILESSEHVMLSISSSIDHNASSKRWLVFTNKRFLLFHRVSGGLLKESVCVFPRMAGIHIESTYQLEKQIPLNEIRSINYTPGTLTFYERASYNLDSVIKLPHYLEDMIDAIKTEYND